MKHEQLVEEMVEKALDILNECIKHTPLKIEQTNGTEYDKGYIFYQYMVVGSVLDNTPKLKELITTTAQKAKADWLRSEIEKLESLTGISRNPDFYLELQRLLDGNIAMKDIDNFQLTQIAWEAKDLVLTSIITRYKEELAELER